jgi:hypothetical protein
MEKSIAEVDMFVVLMLRPAAVKNPIADVEIFVVLIS